MKHPLLSNLRYLIGYGAFWFAIAMANALILWNFYRMDVGHAFVSTFIQYFLYAVIGLSIWYVVKYNSPETHKWWTLSLFHLIAATILIIIWTYLSSMVLRIVAPALNDYMIMSLPSRILMGYLLYTFYVLLFISIIYYLNFKEKVQRESELKSLIKEAELHALKSQINPHFLFNSLNSISSLTMSDPAKAQEMVINLSSLMRYSLKHNQNEKVSFETELQNNQLYLAIEKVRFGNKLQPVFNVDQNCCNASLPNMILQPIYENAIKYGVYEATEPVEIITTAVCNNNFLKISVENPYDPGVLNKKGEGIGLRNIRERLQIIYGGAALITINDSNAHFKITVAIPQN